MNKRIAYIEIAMVLWVILWGIIPDWNKPPLTKNYVALLVIGELIFDLYSKFKKRIK